MLRDVGLLLNCFLCDSVYVITLRQLDLAEFRGRAGKDAMDDRLFALQSKLPAVMVERCPTCLELCRGVPFREWLASDLECLLSPAQPLRFAADELPPLYLDEGDGSGRPRWRLLQGLGALLLAPARPLCAPPARRSQPG